MSETTILQAMKSGLPRIRFLTFDLQIASLIVPFYVKEENGKTRGKENKMSK